ncbi:hypothetical protein PENTCL1PPCAC_14188, partial [Pristionchus entomophagus]
TFFLNGNEVSVENPDPELTLATFLRYQLDLTGTKLACEEGACGACTVAIARWNTQEQRARFVSANACITPLFLVDGSLVLTVEGIGTQKRLHPIQERLAAGNASQCGFCSPGFVMAAYALLRLRWSASQLGAWSLMMCRRVKVEYERLPAILTIEDAIAASSFLFPKPMAFGKSQVEIDGALLSAPILIEGEVSIGGQEHLYMETQSSIVIPEENDEWTVYSSTQNPSDAQYLCASVLGIPASKVVVKVKRLGGGFGGKQTCDRIAREPAIVAANKLRKPVSCVLHRSDDMAATGKRHPALFKYRVGIDDDGRLLAVHVVQYLQAGYSMDSSFWIASMIMYSD